MVYIEKNKKDYSYFKKNNSLISKDLSKQQKLDANPKAMQQINFTRSTEKETSVFSIIAKAKETVLDVQKEELKYIGFVFFQNNIKWHSIIR